MKLEWLIDMMKEWVLAQAYATEAWVLEWIAPVNVTGEITPDVTCTYFKAGTHGGKPYYKNGNGWYIYWYEFTRVWILGETPNGYSEPSWFRDDENVLGTYEPYIGATGYPVVSVGRKFLCHSFVDRGDPATPDWTEAAFTEDSYWHDLDCSGIVPAGAKAVLFSMWMRNSFVNKDFWLREKGNTGLYNMSMERTRVSNIWIFTDLSCPCDSDRFCSYRFAAGGVWTCRLTVKGWWL